MRGQEKGVREQAGTRVQLSQPYVHVRPNEVEWSVPGPS